VSLFQRNQVDVSGFVADAQQSAEASQAKVAADDRFRA
jgi:hypothetical protein